MRNKKGEKVTLKRKGDKSSINYIKLRKAVLVLRAVNHKLRQRILDLLEDQERLAAKAKPGQNISESMTVTDIYIKLRLEQSVASQHLAILRRAGVVKTQRQGKFIYYRRDKNRIKKMDELIQGLVG